ncbi:hypothetical protein ACET1I_06400 [Escherichia coli]
MGGWLLFFCELAPTRPESDGLLSLTIFRLVVSLNDSDGARVASLLVGMVTFRVVGGYGRWCWRIMMSARVAKVTDNVLKAPTAA